MYDFREGSLTASTFFRLPVVKLAAGRTTLLKQESKLQDGVPYPAAIALLPARDGFSERLLVVENLSDTVAILDARTGQMERRFDLGVSPVVPSAYPVALAVTRTGQRAFVALWNASEIVELDLVANKVSRRIPLLKPRLATAAGSHPCALLLDEARGILYVALSNRDSVAAVSVGTQSRPFLRVRGYFDTRLPHQSYFGAEPDALALNGDGSRLYAANMGTNSIAVFDSNRVKSMARAKGMNEPLGFIPTELMPISLAATKGKLYILTAKGQGTGPNAAPQIQTADTEKMKRFQRPFTYAPTLLHGSVAQVAEESIASHLKLWTEQVLVENRMLFENNKIVFEGRTNPIRHVIYVIKENRTYDQVFGDLSVHGKAVGNGDPSLTMYGAAITPNQHKLALQFGVLDNFFDSGEVSGSGHVWSTAAIGTDYLEKTWQINYRGSERTYDYEGMVADGYPLLQNISDVNEASSGYLWGNLAAHHRTLYHFGEFISSTFCKEKSTPKTTGSANPQAGAMSGDVAACASASVAPGDVLPREWGGGRNKWPWAIPRLAGNVATKPELVGHFAPEAPDFNLRIPDEIRTEIFLRHFAGWARERVAGNDTMPSFVLMRLGNDHTEGTRAGGPTPRASVADNDLAVGRLVEAVSHSAFWDDTAIFIVEDDAQNGGDHVDAHRSLALVISKYAPHASSGAAAVVDSTFYSTVSVVRTMESLLGLPPMNNNDAFAPNIASLFTGPGDQPAFDADMSNRTNGLVYTANPPSAPGNAASQKMDFTHADRANARALNLVLWRDAMGNQPPPVMILQKTTKRKDDDD